MNGAGLTEVMLQEMGLALLNLPAFNEFCQVVWRLVRSVQAVMFHSHQRHTRPRPTET
jgi:hypothetical protein